MGPTPRSSPSRPAAGAAILAPHTSPGTDKKSPYTFTTTGTLQGASFIPAIDRCTGKVGVRYYNGRASWPSLSRRSAATASSSRRPRASGARAAKARSGCKVTVDFRGNGYIAPVNKHQQRDRRLIRQRAPGSTRPGARCTRRGHVARDRRHANDHYSCPPCRRAARGSRRLETALLAAPGRVGAVPARAAARARRAAHAQFTGADGLIGADGVLGADQLQYLAWARDASAHGGLASDLFSFSQGGHVYLQPLFTIIGALYRLGLSLPLAYLLWKPVGNPRPRPGGGGVGAALLRRSAGGASGRRDDLAVSVHTRWRRSTAGLSGRRARFASRCTCSVTSCWPPTSCGATCPARSASPWSPWRCWPPSAPSIPIPGRAAWRSTSRRPHVAARPLIVAALAALVASWLHPWQGITLGLIFVGLAVLRRLRGWAALALAGDRRRAAAARLLRALPPRSGVEAGGHYEVIGRLPAIVLLAGFGPLALIAALRGEAARRRAHRAGAAVVGGGLRGHLLRQRLLRTPRPPGPQPPVRGAGGPRLAPLCASPRRSASPRWRSSPSRAWPTTPASSSAPPRAEARAVLPPPVRRPGAGLGRPARPGRRHPGPHAVRRRRPLSDRAARSGSATGTGARTTPSRPARWTACSAAGCPRRPRAPS